MKNKKQTATTEEWITYGKRAKTIFEDLQHLRCDPIMQNSMTTRDFKGLDRAIKGMTSFKSDAENAMFKAKKQPENDPLGVFYGKTAP